MRLHFLILLIFASIGSKCQSYINQSINSNWLFYKGDTTTGAKISWENISLPHSFNTHDVQDDEPGYYRGITWYRKTIYIPSSWAEKDVYLHFEAANQVATVYVNGKEAIKHIGGYNAFNVRLNDFLSFNNSGASTEIAVKVNNAYNADIPTLTADFTFFGGIYRDVTLQAFHAVHFQADNYASRGVFISTPAVSAEKASLLVRGDISNTSLSTQTLKVVHTLLDREGKTISRGEQKVKIGARGTAPFESRFPAITAPRLWSPEDPYLYKMVSSITDAATGMVLDETTNPVGFRWYRFSGDSGFYLNGRPYKLWGASRHQDQFLMGNALPDALHVKDVRMLKEMGGNFLRVAHYPQDPAVMEACDRLGILTCVEVPIVNTITETAAFYENSKNMQVEMIRQNFNHPSIIMWAYMNEVLLKSPFKKDSARQEIYFKNVVQLARSIDSLIQKEDPYRYTMLVFSSNYDLFKRIGLLAVPQVVGWNLYNGWYTANIEKFGEHIDRHHREFPQTPVLITEYGADGDPRIRSLQPVRFDKSQEYATYYHKEYIKAISSRPYVSGGIAWNLADFNSETREEAMPHINNKGLMDIHRQPKDVYHLYQSKLLKTPFLRIGSRSWDLRSGIAQSDSQLYCMQKVEMYTNQTGKVTLTLNGKNISTVAPVDGVAGFDVPFVDGVNQLEAMVTANGEVIRDVIDIRFLLQPANLRSVVLPFQEINVSLGDDRYFIDKKPEQVWIPEKKYQPGSWGYIGGSVYKLPNSTRHPYGSDKNITGTEYDPVYATQRVGIEQFKLDVPDGRYEVTLHFAELISDIKRETLVYNLDNKERVAEGKAERMFDVTVNSMPFIEGLGSNNYLIPETAYQTKCTIDVKGNKGLVLDFTAKKGHTVLNGIQVRKIF
jgi:beta-galactosidase